MNYFKLQVCILSLFLITTYMGLHANAQTANSTDDGQDTPMPTETDTAADSNSTGIDNSENSANTTAGDGASTDSSATTATTTGANDTTTTVKTAETTSAGPTSYNLSLFGGLLVIVTSLMLI